MLKGNVKLHDYISLLPPSARLKIFDGDNELRYEGYKANFAKTGAKVENTDIKHITTEYKFTKKAGSQEEVSITETNAGDFNYADLKMKTYILIYLF